MASGNKITLLPPSSSSDKKEVRETVFHLVFGCTHVVLACSARLKGSLRATTRPRQTRRCAAVRTSLAMTFGHCAPLLLRFTPRPWLRWSIRSFKATTAFFSRTAHRAPAKVSAFCFLLLLLSRELTPSLPTAIVRSAHIRRQQAGRERPDCALYYRCLPEGWQPKGAHAGSDPHCRLLPASTLFFVQATTEFYIALSMFHIREKGG
jgi:hypothetical protein